jgi:type IV secretory pathway TrbF-like protein
MILIGIGYSAYAASLWACIPYVVEPKTIGTAFGITTALQNIGLSIGPTI